MANKVRAVAVIHHDLIRSAQACKQDGSDSEVCHRWGHIFPVDQPALMAVLVLIFSLKVGTVSYPRLVIFILVRNLLGIFVIGIHFNNVLLGSGLSHKDLI